MRFFEKFGVRVEERGGGIETPDELAGYGGGDGISGGASPYTLDLDLYNILYLDLNILYILDIDI